MSMKFDVETDILKKISKNGQVTKIKILENQSGAQSPY